MQHHSGVDIGDEAHVAARPTGVGALGDVVVNGERGEGLRDADAVLAHGFQAAERDRLHPLDARAVHERARHQPDARSVESTDDIGGAVEGGGIGHPRIMV